MNVRLGFDHLRPMQAADIQIGDAPAFDFARDVERSVLPLMLRDARQAGLTLCFVRVQRRPTANRPPPQSPALVAYVARAARVRRRRTAPSSTTTPATRR